jgi:hypothetical protein
VETSVEIELKHSKIQVTHKYDLPKVESEIDGERSNTGNISGSIKRLTF